MGCGGTKFEMSKTDLIEWVKKEKAIFQEEYEKEGKKESAKLMQTLQKGMSNGDDPLAEGLKAYGDIQKNVEFQISKVNYLDSFLEIEAQLQKGEYNRLILVQDIFCDFLKLKENKEFELTNVVMERFRQFCRENAKNREVIISDNPVLNGGAVSNNDALKVN